MTKQFATETVVAVLYLLMGLATGGIVGYVIADQHTPTTPATQSFNLELPTDSLVCYRYGNDVTCDYADNE